MTFRLSMISAAILFSANVALAGPIPISTDEARALAGRSLPAAGSVVAITSSTPTSTDEARVLAGRALPTTAPRTLAFAAGGPISTDEARGLSGVTIRVAPSANEHQDAVACQHSCGCHHG
jgi:hypothetical protein